MLDAHKSTILITGGAGYIGSNTALLFAKRGYQVVIIDSFRYKQQFTPSWATVIKSDFSDSSVLNQIFTQYVIKGVIHFAGLIEVGASVTDPENFYANNVAKTLILLNKMREHLIQNFIFSSSAAVYGTPCIVPIPETHTCNPINPYGSTKYIVERILKDFDSAYGFKHVALRYFNAAGADVQNQLGERHIPETHAIPLLLAATREDKEFKIFGGDYATPDGTCIRDYLHVKDLAQAHYQAFEYLNAGEASSVFNLGTGCGTSVKQLVDVVRCIVEKNPRTSLHQRRCGDPERLVADAVRAKKVLAWVPCHSSIEEIISDAWQFYQLNSVGLFGVQSAQRVDEII